MIAAMEIIQKMACQENQIIAMPPKIGANSGAIVITSKTKDMLRENSSLLNISLIKAVMTTLAAAADNPCKKRTKINCSILLAKAQIAEVIAKIITPPNITG